MTKENLGVPSEVADYAAAFREFDTVQNALLDLFHHFQLVDQRLWNNFATLPEEYHAAATVLHDAVPMLDKLLDRHEDIHLKLSDVRYGRGWRERLKKEMGANPRAAGLHNAPASHRPKRLSQRTNEG